MTPSTERLLEVAGLEEARDAVLRVDCSLIHPDTVRKCCAALNSAASDIRALAHKSEANGVSDSGDSTKHETDEKEK